MKSVLAALAMIFAAGCAAPDQTAEGDGPLPTQIITAHERLLIAAHNACGVMYLKLRGSTEMRADGSYVETITVACLSGQQFTFTENSP